MNLLNYSKSIILSLIAYVACATTTAHADPIFLSDGASYRLTYEFVNTVGPNSTYKINMHIDLTNFNNYSGGQNAYIGGVEANIFNPASAFVSTLLTSAPGVLANWVTNTNGLNSNGCVAGSSGSICSQDGANMNLHDAPTPIIPGTGNIYDWFWDLTVTTGSLATGPLQSSIKVLYVDANGDFGNELVSEHITLQVAVPEPSTYLFLGSLLGAMMLFKRKQKVQPPVRI